MLFNKPIATLVLPDIHEMKLAKESGLSSIVFQLDHGDYMADELKELIQFVHMNVDALRIPQDLALGLDDLNLKGLVQIIQLAGEICTSKPGMVILHSHTVTLGEIFEYLEKHARDFQALQDFKDHWVNKIISQIRSLIPIAQKNQVILALENAPMGGMEYFESGHGYIHPALRTPRHLKSIVKETGIKLCFDTANARITTNALTYMKRSRSLFAGATENEILSSPSNWLDFYKEIKEDVAMILLSDSISWGDTATTSHIPFREDHFPELLSFAEMLEGNIPIALSLNETGKPGEQLQKMMQILHQLKPSGIR
ncbi:sugar phosphate isomerase/epimerase [Microaerobacter geothermalis]|uniref:sugar phosphate isomerase/epimerase n=1 Tax=Microaerobacter geothermalis TaxID=674972 RepID=UPI001F17E2BA|nr:sugar phosphate isomerase/epimerase [Microaerobacter geothermalis]MCF6092794.1 sugar phosphate isomerase/epimerase [Microaerobacter geothermalis]